MEETSDEDSKRVRERAMRISLGEEHSWQRKQQCKGPGVRAYLVSWSETKETSVAGVE